MKSISELKPGQIVKINLQPIEIVSIPEGSRTVVVVKDIYKGKGWDEELKKYIGVKCTNGWYRGQNYGWGREFKVHIKDIEI